MADNCIECARNAVRHETTKLHKMRSAGASVHELVKQANRATRAQMVLAGIEWELHPWQRRIVEGLAGAQPALPNMAGAPTGLFTHQPANLRGWLVAAITAWTAAAVILIAYAAAVL